MVYDQETFKEIRKSSVNGKEEEQDSFVNIKDTWTTVLHTLQFLGSESKSEIF